MLSMLVSIAWLVASVQAGTVGTPISDPAPAEKAERPSMKAAVHDGANGWILRLTFDTAATSAEQFRTAPGVVVEGRGKTYNAAGEVMASSLEIKLHVADAPVVTNVVSLPDGALVSGFGDDDAGATVRIGPILADGSRDGLVIYYTARSFVTFTTNAEWNARVSAKDSIGVATRVFDLLVSNAVGAARDGGCDPSFEDCQNAANQACAPHGIGALQYSCNPQTGEVTCNFTCREPPGGGR